MSAKVIRLLRFTIDKPTIRLFFIRFELAGSHPETIRFNIYCGGSGITSSSNCCFSVSSALLRFEPAGSHHETIRFNIYCGGSGITSSSYCRFSVSSALLRFEPAGSHPETIRFNIYCGGSGIRTRGTVSRTSV